VERGFLEQNERSERYRLGRNLIILGQNAQHGLGLGQAQQFLERLGTSTGESVNLGVREGADVVVLLRVESRQALRFDQEPGSHIPLHASSMGKSLLAFTEEPARELAELLEGELERFTPTTLVERAALEAEIAEVRRRGFSVDNEESLAGVRCVGVPVLDGQGVARAAIAVQAPAVRMPEERVVALAAELKETAAEISALMGFDGALDGSRGAS
jgi:IclR family transcriptional regulator, acetate operon repressor